MGKCRQEVDVFACVHAGFEIPERHPQGSETGYTGHRWQIETIIWIICVFISVVV